MAWKRNPAPEEGDHDRRKAVTVGLASGIVGAAVDGVAAYLECDRDAARVMLGIALQQLDRHGMTPPW